MATVYSLLCFGGSTGKTVSISASTDVVTLTKHGLINGTKLWPSGTLPAELNTSTPVYARSTAANTFTMHTSSAGAIANTGQITFAGSSTYAAVVLKSDLVADPANALATYGLSDLSRYGSSGSERVYDSLYSWYVARAAASIGTVSEVCEIGMYWLDHTGANSVTIAAEAASWTVTTMLNGVRSAGYHNGSLISGYTITRNNNAIYAMTASIARVSFEGFSFLSPGLVSGISLSAPSGSVKNMILKGASATSTGIQVNNNSAEVSNNVICYFTTGAYSQNGGRANIFANNILFANTNAFGQNNTSQYIYLYNNISVGNITTNWPAWTMNVPCVNNIGEDNGASGYLLGTPLGTSPAAMLTTDFANYAGTGIAPNWTVSPDLHPATSTSPQVDYGVVYYGILDADIADDERPNYNNGGSEGIDCGAYEFDHGYGPHPASTTVTFTGVNAGSEIRVYNAAGTALAGVESCDANHALTWSVDATALTVRIVHVDYKIKEFQYTNVAGAVSLPIQQEADKWYSNPV